MSEFQQVALAIDDPAYQVYKERRDKIIDNLYNENRSVEIPCVEATDEVTLNINPLPKISSQVTANVKRIANYLDQNSEQIISAPEGEVIEVASEKMDESGALRETSDLMMKSGVAFNQYGEEIPQAEVSTDFNETSAGVSSDGNLNINALSSGLEAAPSLLNAKTLLIALGAFLLLRR